MKKLIFILAIYFIIGIVKAQGMLDTVVSINSNNPVPFVLKLENEGFAVYGFTGMGTFQVRIFDKKINELFNYQIAVAGPEQMNSLVYHKLSKKVVILFERPNKKSRFVTCSTVEQKTELFDFEARAKTRLENNLYDAGKNVWLTAYEKGNGFVFRFDPASGAIDDLQMGEDLNPGHFLRIMPQNNGEIIYTAFGKNGLVMMVVDAEQKIFSDNLLAKLKNPFGIGYPVAVSIGKGDYFIIGEYIIPKDKYSESGIACARFKDGEIEYDKKIPYSKLKNALADIGVKNTKDDKKLEELFKANSCTFKTVGIGAEKIIFVAEYYIKYYEREKGIDNEYKDVFKGYKIEQSRLFGFNLNGDLISEANVPLHQVFSYTAFMEMGDYHTTFLNSMIDSAKGNAFVFHLNYDTLFKLKVDDLNEVSEKATDLVKLGKLEVTKKTFQWQDIFELTDNKILYIVSEKRKEKLAKNEPEYRFNILKLKIR